MESLVQQSEEQLAITSDSEEFPFSLPSSEYYEKYFVEQRVNCLKQRKLQRLGKYRVRADFAPRTHGLASDSLCGLKLISLNDASKRVNHIHKGSILFLRVEQTPYARIGSLTLLCNDMFKTLCCATFCNIVDSDESSSVVFPKGKLFALVHPYLQCRANTQQIPSLRGDNPQAVVLFENEDEWKYCQGDGNVSKDLEQYRILELGKSKSMIEIRNEGDGYLKKNQFAKAIEIFSHVLNSHDVDGDLPDKSLLFAHRSECFSKLNRWKRALDDGKSALEYDNSNLKAIYYICLSLAMLQRWDESQIMCDKMCDEFGQTPRHTVEVPVVSLKGGIKRGLAEKQGVFDFVVMQRDFLKSGRVSGIHSSFFSSQIAVRSIPSTSGSKKGRGVFAVENIEDGTLLLAEKAICFEVLEEVNDDAHHTNDFTLSGASHKNFTSLVRLMYNIPEVGEDIYRMDPGPGFAAEFNSDSDYSSRIDVLRLKGIVSCNAFGGNLDVNNNSSTKFSGIWPRGARFNHSCDPNCFYYHLGDYIFFYANRNIAKGEEICDSYIDFDQSYRKRNVILNNWISKNIGFRCECARCVSVVLNDDDDEDEQEKKNNLFELEERIFDAQNNQQMSSEEASELKAILRKRPLKDVRILLSHLIRVELSFAIRDGDSENVVSLFNELVDTLPSVYENCLTEGGLAFFVHVAICSLDMELANGIFRKVARRSCSLPFGSKSKEKFIEDVQSALPDEFPPFAMMFGELIEELWPSK